MPTHDHRCAACQAVEERFIPSDALDAVQRCACGGEMERVFLRAPMGFVRAEVNYASPVDGRPITSWRAHVEELARTNCVVYEPGIKQDQDRNTARREAEIEKSIDATVEREIALMPAAKRDRLGAELEAGLTAEPTRGNAPAKPIVTELAA